MKANEFKDDKKKAYAFLVFSWFKGDTTKAARILSIPKNILSDLYTEFSGAAEDFWSKAVDEKRMEVNAKILAEKEEERERKSDRVNLRKLREKILKRIDELAENCDDPSKLATVVKTINDLSNESASENVNGSSDLYDFVKRSKRK